MIPQRLPMPGNAKVAVDSPVAVKPPPTGPLAGLEEAPESAPVVTDDSMSEETGTPTVVKADPSFVPPPRPKTSGRPGAPIQFSAAAVQAMIKEVENCLAPRVSFSEDVNAMRTEASRVRTEGLQRVLAALKNPA